MENLRDYIFNLRHQKYRKKVDEIAQNYHDLALSDKERVVRRFEYMCENEEAVILNNQQIVFMRTISNLPDCFTKEEWSEKFKNHYIHESGYVSNLLPDYTSIIKEGLLKVKERRIFKKVETQAEAAETVRQMQEEIYGGTGFQKASDLKH